MNVFTRTVAFAGSVSTSSVSWDGRVTSNRPLQPASATTDRPRAMTIAPIRRRRCFFMVALILYLFRRGGWRARPFPARSEREVEAQVERRDRRVAPMPTVAVRRTAEVDVQNVR